MLRLIPQLLRSSEIQLFEGLAPLGEGKSESRHCEGGVAGGGGGGSLKSENHEKIKNFDIFSSKNDFSKKYPPRVMEHPGMT